VLIFLGLLGTFYGLLETVRSVGDVIGALNIGAGDVARTFADLKSGLELPLHGMGTAFSASLFGLAGSLVLGFLDLQAGQAQNRFYNGTGGVAVGVYAALRRPVERRGRRIGACLYSGVARADCRQPENLQRIIARGEESRIGANSTLVSPAQISSFLPSVPPHWC